MMPTATAASAAARATSPKAPNAMAATGRPSRLRSANREAPRIASEKTNVNPMPATKAATTVLSSAWVSTIVASIRSLRRRDRRSGPDPSGERRRDQPEPGRRDHDGPGGAAAEDL